MPTIEATADDIVLLEEKEPSSPRRGLLLRTLVIAAAVILAALAISRSGVSTGRAVGVVLFALLAVAGFQIARRVVSRQRTVRAQHDPLMVQEVASSSADAGQDPLKLPAGQSAEASETGESTPPEGDNRPEGEVSARAAVTAAIDAAGAARSLMDRNVQRAIIVSPEGDEAAAVAVVLARAVADAGFRTLAMDLTAGGAVTRPMLESVTHMGITNLLASEATFTETIHEDHFSNCHIMPVGTADPVRAMAAADRLPALLESLAAAYDLILVECGPADARAIRSLVTGGTDVLVSTIEGGDAVASALDDLRANDLAAQSLVGLGQAAATGEGAAARPAA